MVKLNSKDIFNKKDCDVYYDTTNKVTTYIPKGKDYKVPSRKNQNLIKINN